MPNDATYREWIALGNRVMAGEAITAGEMSAEMFASMLDAFTARAVGPARAMLEVQQEIGHILGVDPNDQMALAAALNSLDENSPQAAAIEKLEPRAERAGKAMMEIAPALQGFATWSLRASNTAAEPATAPDAQTEPVEQPGMGLTTTIKIWKSDAGFVLSSHRVEADGSTQPMGATSIAATTPLTQELSGVFKAALAVWKHELGARGMGGIE